MKWEPPKRKLCQPYGRLKRETREKQDRYETATHCDHHHIKKVDEYLELWVNYET